MRRRPVAREAFTMVELLVVMAIMAILVAGLLYGIRGMGDSGKFNQSITNISGILEQARAYANAQDTYVWVVLYESDPTSGPPDVYVGAFASNDGTDPLNWSGSVTLPTPGTVGTTGTTLVPVVHFYHAKGLHLQTTTLPSSSGTPSLPANTPNFICTTQGESGAVSLSSANAVYWVIQFAPNGMARNSANPISSIWLGLQPAHSATSFDPNNIASIKVNGLTGLNTIYRR